ncbi:hypothetical protein, partial [Mycobacterium marinum]|uniref:hypothetical protein n=1 Tax=Mycobacterium marinum TaxID=1781 RepID=UPI00356A37E1
GPAGASDTTYPVLGGTSQAAGTARPANSTIYDDGADSGIATLAADTTGAADTVPECLTTVATVATEAAALARATIAQYQTTR